MKRVMSLLIALSLLIGLLPVVIAAPTEPSGIKITYDIAGVCANYASANTEPFENLSYNLTHGFWKYLSNANNYTVPASSSFRYRASGFQIYSERWIALEVYIPAAGTYNMSIYNGEYSGARKMGVYFMPSGTTVNSLAFSTYKTGEVDCYNASAGSTFPARTIPNNVGTITVAEPGNYQFVFRGLEANKYFSVGTFVLESGSGAPVLMSASLGIEENNLEVGETATATISSYMSDGTKTNATSGLTVKYASSASSVATVDENSGLITGIGEGVAEISVTASLGSYTVTDKKSITIQSSNASGVKAIYNFIGGFAYKTDVKSITYARTNGFWSWCDTNADAISVGIHTTYGIQIQSNSAAQWFALKMNVPAAGRYNISMEHGLANSGCVGGVYIMPSGTEDIGSAIGEDTLVGTADYYAASGVAKTNKLLGSWTFPSAGEYIVAYKYISASENGGTKYNMYPGKLTLDGGSETIPLSVGVTLSKSSIELASSETATATAQVFLSDGTLGTETAVLSSSDESVATVNADGVVTPHKTGTTNIIGTWTAVGGRTVSGSAELTVTYNPTEPAGVKLTYDIAAAADAFNGQNIEPSEVFSYSKTNDTFKYLADSNNTTTTSSSFKYVSTGIQVYTTRWVAFEIYVPTAGLYKVLNYNGTYSNAGMMNIYVTPSDTSISTSSLNSGSLDDYKVGEVNLYNANSGTTWPVSDIPTSVGSLAISTPGYYKLVFRGMSAGKYFHPSTLVFNGVNCINKINGKIADDTIDVGADTSASFTATRLDGSDIAASALQVAYSSSDEAVARVDANGKITGVAEGRANITISATDTVGENDYTERCVLPITVTDNSGVKSISFTCADSLFVRDTTRLKLSAEMNSGNTIEIPASSIDYALECEPEGAAEISKDGVLSARKEGTVTVTASTLFKGTSVFEQHTVNMIYSGGKTEPTYYTHEKRETIAENAKKYSWAASAVKEKTRYADAYVDSVDVLYNRVIGEGVPRGRQIGAPNDPEYNLCRYCGENIVGKYGASGVGGWEINMFTRPWKVKCPDCQRVFPSNDFEKFYELGRDEHGYFDVNRAHEKNDELIKNGETGYLKNVLYPETAEKFGDADWGVDDGFGYMPKDENGNNKVYSNGVIARHGYVALYHYTIWSTLQSIVNTLADAYVYSGEIKYGRVGAILLDRIADVYPSYDINPYKAEFFNTHGGSGFGKLQGRISDCTIAKSFALACDAFYPALEDNTVISYLNEKSQKFKLENDKSSALKIWNNWENGILEEVFRASKTADLYGNYGMQQHALASAAVVLSKEPESREMIDWIFKSGGLSGHTCTGGNLAAQLVDVVDRDGMGDENAPNYNSVWVNRLYLMADVLSMYKGDGDYDIYKNPKFAQMFMSYIPLVLTQSNHAQIGDSGATASLDFVDTVNLCVEGFAHLKDTVLAKSLANYIYMRNGFKTDGLNYGIFSENPESIQDEIKALVDEKANPESETMTGFGFSVLRDGKYYKSAGVNSDINNQRDFWMYFGAGGGHGHSDKLNLGIEAFGLNLAPELGYPTNTGMDPNRQQWVSTTLSHNTVMVDKVAQAGEGNRGSLKNFDDSGMVKVMDADASSFYNSTSIYRRTVVMIEASDDVSYGVDFFRILSGDSHLYSFHAQAEDATPVEGLNLVAQDGGSYAGADVPWGQDPDTQAAWSYNTRYPRGYTWLKNVRRDSAPSEKFSVDFAIKDYRNAVKDNRNIHLRMTMLNDFALTELAIAGGPVPVKTANNMMPETFDYVLAKREGADLDTLFTTVFEPYKGSRYLSTMESVTLSATDGTLGANDVAKAVKITHTSGRTDYVVYATNNKVTYNVGGVFNFRGAIGVYTVNKNGENIYRYVNNGDIIGSSTGKTDAYSGTVSDFSKNLTFDNYIDVNLDTENESELDGRHIYVENDKKQDGAYKIERAESLGNGKIRLHIGAISLIRAYKNDDDFSNGFVYNIAAGQKFSIPMSFKDEFAPIFEAVADRSVSAGSVISLQFKATSPLGLDVECFGATIPRGATFDTETATLRWKPDSSQVGENHIAIRATDSAGREQTIHFAIKVLGSTTGGGGGGGGGQTDPTPTDPTEPEPVKPTPVEPVPPVTENGFTDLEGYDWAKDAINTLAESDVIKGVGENMFAPGDSITRADFAILLVRAFKLTSESIDNFADVSQSDYFASELAIAKATGIVGGIGDGKYAPRNKITREDMMVIVYRALTKLGYELSSEDEITTFYDAENISDYAVDAVAALIANDLITGSNGKINPKATTTRAEVAVLLKRILDLKE